MHRTTYHDPLLQIAGAVERIDERTDHILGAVEQLRDDHHELSHRVTRLEAGSRPSPMQWLRDNKSALILWALAGGLATGHLTWGQVLSFLGAGK